MSLQIWFKDQVVYDGRKGPFELVYENLLEIYDDKLYAKELNPVNGIAKCIEAMIVCRGGVGIDIANYIQSKSELNTLARFLYSAIQKYVHEFPNEPKGYKDELWRFYKNLLEIAETLR